MPEEKPSGWLVAHWPELMSELDAAYPDPDVIHVIFEKELAETWPKLGKLTSKTSIKKPITWTRKHILATFPGEKGEMIHAAFNASKSVWNTINAGTAVSVKARMEDQQYLYHVDEIVARGVTLLASEKWPELALGLIVVTGRRVNEILESGSFVEKTAYSVIFTGQLKQGEHEIGYEIPTLCKASLVIDALSRLRAMKLPTDTSNNPRNVRDLANERFSDIVTSHRGRLTSHTFRGVYTKIAIFYYCPLNVADIHFATNIEGHKSFVELEDGSEIEDDYGSVQHYSDYVITLPNGQPDKRKGIKLNTAGVKVLEAFTAAAKLPSLDTIDPANIGRPSGVLTASNGMVMISDLSLPADVVQSIQEAMLVMGRTDMITWIVDAVRAQSNIQRGQAKRGDIAAMNADELKGVKTTQATNERIRRAVAAIEAYNDKAASPLERWHINATSIHDLVGGRPASIRAYVAEHKAEIDAMNSKYSLKTSYNSKPGPQIEDLITVK
jgi:Telomere resolvase